MKLMKASACSTFSVPEGMPTGSSRVMMPSFGARAVSSSAMPVSA
jgi:hypothetical protein